MSTDRPNKRLPLFRPSVLAALIAWAIYEVVFYGLAVPATNGCVREGTRPALNQGLHIRSDS
jgi:hypothetical protein